MKRLVVLLTLESVARLARHLQSLNFVLRDHCFQLLVHFLVRSQHLRVYLLVVLVQVLLLLISRLPLHQSVDHRLVKLERTLLEKAHHSAHLFVDALPLHFVDELEHLLDQVGRVNV